MVARGWGRAAGAAVCGAPGAERPGLPLDGAAALLGVVSFVAPLTGDQRPHRLAPYAIPGPLAAKWQAANWPALISRIIGSSAAQRACTSGQRVRNRQPLGGAIGEGGSPHTTPPGGGPAGAGRRLGPRRAAR